jgi:D-aminopeptidase
MVTCDFKGGIGTSSRKLPEVFGGFTLGVLVMSNFGKMHNLRVGGLPVGEVLAEKFRNVPKRGNTYGSIIAVVATDAPLLPHQLKRVARRVPLGIGRTGGFGANSSGDIFIAFSSANRSAWSRSGIAQLDMLPNDLMDPLLKATVQATEEAVLNALVGAETMAGRDGNTAHAIPHDRLREVLRGSGRLIEQKS